MEWISQLNHSLINFFINMSRDRYYLQSVYQYLKYQQLIYRRVSYNKKVLTIQCITKKSLRHVNNHLIFYICRVKDIT